MRLILLLCLLCWTALTGAAQTAPAPIQADRQPDVPTMTATIRALRRTSSASESTKDEVDKLLATLPNARSGGEVRRILANAAVLLSNGTWGQNQEFAWSLDLRPDRTVADSTLPFIARLTQFYPASRPSSGNLQVRMALLRDNGTELRQIGQYNLVNRDLIDQPLGMDADLNGVEDGAYLLRAELLDAGSSVAASSVNIQIVHGIERERASIEQRLSRIAGQESTKASIRYPYVLAETVNAGRRRLNAADFGLPFQPKLPYDFVQGVQTSASILKALEAGKTPLYRAKGDTERHYWFEEAREMMAYHVYVPQKWDGRSKLPMVLVLHGNTRDQDYYFDRDDHILSKLAEQHGYLVVCPMGYRPNAGWGSGSLNRRAGVAADPLRTAQGDLSEKDALHVFDLVTKEYPIDPARTYLFGHSAGGAGTWYMGEKYADRWAAIAASAAPTRPDGFPFERLSGVPILVCHGDKDDEVPVSASRNMMKAAKEHGLNPQYLEVPGATHLTIVAIAEPKVFEFFDLHLKGK